MSKYLFRFFFFITDRYIRQGRPVTARRNCPVLLTEALEIKNTTGIVSPSTLHLINRDGPIDKIIKLMESSHNCCYIKMKMVGCYL